MLFLSHIFKNFWFYALSYLTVVSGTFCAAGTICSVLSLLSSDITEQHSNVVMPACVTGMTDNPNLPIKAQV